MARKKIREIKEPTQNMLDFYEKLFLRNQSKWIRRSHLEQSHLGSEFVLEGEKYKLLGSSSSMEVVIKNQKSDKYFIVSIDEVTRSILNPA
jgi:hypothetical protein